MDVQANEKIANEVDDTFGFGNIIEDAIKDKVYQNQKKENKNANRNESGSSRNGTQDGDSRDNTNTDKLGNK